MPHNEGMETIGMKIRRMRQEAGLSQAEFARRMGFADHTPISKIENGKLSLSADQLAKAALVLGRDIAEFAVDAERRSALVHPPLNPSTPTTTSRIPEVDVRGGMGGGGLMALEVNHVDEWGNSIAADNVRATWELPNDYLRHELRVAPSKAYLIEVRGDSMSPTLETGDRVMIDTADTVPAPGGVFALFDGLGVVVKRLEHVPMSDPPIIKIISDNPHHGVYERTLEEIRIIGRAIWFGRRM